MCEVGYVGYWFGSWITHKDWPVERDKSKKYYQSNKTSHDYWKVWFSTIIFLRDVTTSLWDYLWKQNNIYMRTKVHLLSQFWQKVKTHENRHLICELKFCFQEIQCRFRMTLLITRSMISTANFKIHNSLFFAPYLLSTLFVYVESKVIGFFKVERQFAKRVAF